MATRNHDAGNWQVGENPRFMQDLDRDDKDDLVAHPPLVTDVNGDGNADIDGTGKADIVGFGTEGTFVSRYNRDLVVFD